ncbi:unnamed protein product [Polarella glacialis]|uniref:Poly [ADP-ribose] polymerase n=1 Tax=Polarella glacialis TaxID=89957 RepID=A0A813FNL3_POLGL|nr:unnamed protein product [Polarella glacialis]
MHLLTNSLTYSIDFATMTQKNMETGRCHRIRRGQRLKPEALRSLQEQADFSKKQQLEITNLKKTIRICKIFSKTRKQHTEKRERDAKDQERQLRARVSSAEVEAETRQRQFETQLDACKREAEVKDQKRREQLDTVEQDADAQQRVLRANIDTLQQVAATLTEDLQKATQAESASRLQMTQFLHQGESWRLGKQLEIPHLTPIDCPFLVAIIENMMRTTSHHGPNSRCSPMRQAKVLRVLKVHNVRLGQKYDSRCKQMLQDHADQGVAVGPLTPDVNSFLQSTIKAFDEWMHLEASLHECLLLHGSKRQNISEIVSSGFEERLSRQGGLYGEGIYFAEESCKSFQYCDKDGGENSMILSRVLLGDPHYAKGPLGQMKISPKRDEADATKGRHNSVVANVGTPNGQPPPSVQEHREYVIFDGSQAYPEYVVIFEV